MASVTEALDALNVGEYSLRGTPATEAEFNQMFAKVTGATDDGTAIESSDPSDFGVTWAQISAKLTELNNAEPMKFLRAKRDELLSETDWWAGSDLTMTQAQIDYRQALRDITDNATSLDDVTWPTKP